MPGGSRPLPSFPTRRSSDLWPCSASQAAAATDLHLPTKKNRPRAAFFRRSEEHTSELQSRPHLVCRLLLEKKKNPQEFSAAVRVRTELLNSRISDDIRRGRR